MLYNVVLISVGLLISLLLFYRFPILKQSASDIRLHRISVIIPARNEEINLSLLLQDLKQQTIPLHEIICVDDCSLDDTAKIALSFGAVLISIENKPEDWTGKAWACQKGADAASGDILLFLDADVRLSPDAISRMMQAYDDNKCVISVQPYHQTKKNYEQFSLFFNIVQIAANAISTSLHFENPGLYGPVILIDQETYQAIDGHISAKGSIVDDLALGEKLTQKGFPFKLFLGGRSISFRMYGGGFSDLLQGWTKNYATGALKTPPLLFLMVFLWVASCTAVTIVAVQAILAQDLMQLVIYSLLYVLWILELLRISRKIGDFKIYAIIFFPIYMTLFLGVMVLSFTKKLFQLNVVWKGRKIKLEK